MYLRLGAVLLSVFSFAELARAAAIYTTTVTSTFGISTGSVTLAPSGPSSATTGAGVADGGGTVSPSGVKPATKDIGVTGTVPFPVSTATSTYMAGHLITIDNLEGSGPITALFTFDYSWLVTLSADFPPLEFASGGGFFHITGIDNEILMIGGISVPDFLASHTFSTAMGGTGGAGSGSVTGSIVVPGGVLSIFSVITDTSGFAASTPEPGTGMLLGLAGLLAIGRARRKR